jgi:DNA-binding PucR family transcriptional regulator
MDSWSELQAVVDALSVRLGRPVLVDDVDLRPLAYSSQFGELDSVRTASILGRGAPDTARDALFAHGIRTAVEPVRIPAHPAIGMAARACIPILRGHRRLGFLWLIEDRPLDDEELRLARAAAADAASLLETEADSQRDRRRREQELLAALLAGERTAAAALDADNYLPLRPLVVCAGVGGRDDAVDRLRARAPAKHALCGEVDGRVVWISGARLHGPLRHVGVGDAVATLECAPASYRHALAALQVATDHGLDLARWDELRAYRLLTALPATAFDDVPDGVKRLLDGSHEQLVLTLESYLDHAGDVKRTAAELWLHRTSLYYRLRRIEEVAGVDLNRGEDRLLCHVALRMARLRRSA